MGPYIVLGMHRSGTSLVAAILRGLGVNMGEQFPRRNRYNRWGYWEDIDFIKANIHLLRKAGGKWSKPPTLDRIIAAGYVPELEGEIRGLIAEKSHDSGRKGFRWGWKDPRTCLTAPVYHRILGSAYYIVVDRDRNAIISSLLRRHRGSPRRRWENLTNIYLSRMNAFVKSIDAPVHHVHFEKLINPETTHDEIVKLGWFLGLKRFRIQLARAKEQVHYR